MFTTMIILGLVALALGTLGIGKKETTEVTDESVFEIENN